MFFNGILVFLSSIRSMLMILIATCMYHDYSRDAFFAWQRHRKTQTERLMSDFSDVLNSFQTAQREAASTEKECVARARAASSTAPERGGDMLVDLQG